MCNSATLWSERVLNSYWRELPLMISGKDWNSWSAWKYPHDEGSISAWEDSYSDVLTTRPTNKKQTVPVKVPANSGYLTPNICFFFFVIFQHITKSLWSSFHLKHWKCWVWPWRAQSWQNFCFLLVGSSIFTIFYPPSHPNLPFLVNLCQFHDNCEIIIFCFLSSFFLNAPCLLPFFCICTLFSCFI